MRAKYCKSKNTYTIDGCKNCNCSEYWKQGIGSIHNDNHISSVLNTDTENVLSYTSTAKPASVEGTVINIDTTRTITS
tara:strand:- start:179 stop:412 length:234 start_codon:yes stop_codon:yes gene_type:complete